MGHARVSTYGQTLDAQLEQLRSEGCAPIYQEKASGAQADRRELQRMLKALAPGDVVTVTQIDRLAVRRSTTTSPWHIDAVGGVHPIKSCGDPVQDDKSRELSWTPTRPDKAAACRSTPICPA